jgi:hypothetical protein
VAADFAKLAYTTLKGYEDWKFEKRLRPIVDKLKEVVMTTRVQSEENLQLDSREVNAINIPAKNLIIVNRTRWPRLKSDEKVQLVLHEYLWIAGYDDSSYQLSAAIQQEGAYIPVVVPIF